MLINTDLITHIRVYYKRESEYTFVPEKKFFNWILEKQHWKLFFIDTKYTNKELIEEGVIIEDKKAYQKPFILIYIGNEQKRINFEDKESLDSFINRYFNNVKYLKV